MLFASPEIHNTYVLCILPKKCETQKTQKIYICVMVCFRKKDLHYTYVFCCVVDQNNNIHMCYVVFVEKPLHNTYVLCIFSEELLHYTNVCCIFLSKQLPDTVLSSFLTVAAAFIPRHANIIGIMQYDTIC